MFQMAQKSSICWIRTYTLHLTPYTAKHASFALTDLLLACVFGCEGTVLGPSNSSQRAGATESQISKTLHYDGGFIFADGDHIVGIDVAEWGLSSPSQVQSIKTSCECVRASLRELREGPTKTVLVVQVAADSKMSRNSTLAVEIVAKLADDSKKILSFDFTHVANPSSSERD